MKIDKAMLKLISELEFIIGWECYNPNSHDGWNDIDGCEFRYPVHGIDCDGEVFRVKGKVHNEVKITKAGSKRTVHSMKYKFGSNHLYIGLGIEKALAFLEERYDIDFNSLEAKYQAEHEEE